MKELLLCSIAAAMGNTLSAQSNNALDFDGLDDAVSVPGASALISNATGLTLSCWVYPRNEAPTYPDFDGFAGMRNELDCDFYLLQISPADAIEGRLRNSNGEVFTITGSGLQLNIWQHVALTYDGALMQLYLDGVVVGSIAASGTISNATVPMLIGDVEYQFTDFFLDGKLDEVGLWNRALSSAEVNCMMAQGADLADAGLQLYYKFDQGVAGGSNTGITQLTDATGHINGDINFFAMTGASSNFLSGAAMGNLISAQICPGETYLFNGQPLTTAGTYTVSFNVGTDCDSVVTLVLGVGSVNTNVVQVGNALTALSALGPYQWIDCNNGFAEVPGANNQNFTPTENGSYAVIVAGGGCTDTSACYNVTGIGIEEITGPIASLSPNPASSMIRLDFDRPYTSLLVEVLDMRGRVVLREGGAGESLLLDIGTLSPGLFQLRFTSEEGSGVARFMKE